MADDLLHTPSTYCDWHEGVGDVLWWRIPISEPPYVGSPLDLGQTIAIELRIGGKPFVQEVRDFGGWPFTGADRAQLWWTPLPDAQFIEDQVPL